MDEHIIEARKEYSKLSNLSRAQAKRGECIWCGKKITRFCNSHSIPQMVLENIDTDGKVDYFNTIVKIPLINEDKGIGEAGTFKLICKECDNRIFQDYENPKKLCLLPNERMLEEIALKNMLVMLNKRCYEIELYSNMQKKYHMQFPYMQKQEVNGLDERDYFWNFNRIRKMMESEEGESKFCLFYWKKLEYKIPIAFQGAIALHGDLEGQIITDIYNKSEDMIIKNMHICMFPLERESVVFAFYHEDDHEYDNFKNQFLALEEEEKLSLLSYLVYEHSEDMIFAKKFPHRTWLINRVRETFMDTTEIGGFSLKMVEIQKNKNLMKLKYRDKTFPNILDRKFSIKDRSMHIEENI